MTGDPNSGFSPRNQSTNTGPPSPIFFCILPTTASICTRTQLKTQTRQTQNGLSLTTARGDACRQDAIYTAVLFGFFLPRPWLLSTPAAAVRDQFRIQPLEIFGVGVEERAAEEIDAVSQSESRL